ncbi:SPO7 [[Candida] subhashii]|uniref:SPO7 n=1 Tax=[Candida] subhashii TaxID=561895 RepID=A0A8J5QX73_9ASCO|nr:SPO7 [[Candida] subhashii]KAG7663925.1 SPO7 [[Candida] subhashii]
MESTKATEEKLSSDDSNSITDKTLSNSDINDKLHDTSITKSDSDTEYSHVSSSSPPPPQSPPDSSSILQEPILLDITPVTSRSKAGNESDEFLLYSDSDVASQSSLDVNTHTPRQQKDSLSPRTILSRRNQSISSEEDELLLLRSNRKERGGAHFGSRKSRKGSTTSGESPSTPNSNSTKKPRRSSRGRRGSGDSDSVAMASGTTTSRFGFFSYASFSFSQYRGSLRSHRSEFYGTGYTSMPASGKIFRNLLILEESLREQVIQQRAMRRKYLTFLSILCSIIASIVHHLFILDSGLSSTGTQRVILQFLLFITIITLLLYHLSGEYQKTIVVPRKFLSSTNKGLRQLNVRLVKIKTPFIDKVTDLIREISLYIVNINLDFFHKLSPMSIQNRNSKIEVFLVGCQSQCQPRIGVTDVKLVLNPRNKL